MSDSRPMQNYSLSLFYQNCESNFGDMLSPEVVACAAGEGSKVAHAPLKSASIVAIGSLMERVQRKKAMRAGLNLGRPLHVWGSGFLAPGPPCGTRFIRIHALRGRLSLERMKGAPECALGDPGLLASLAFPELKWESKEARNTIVVAPHLHDPHSRTWGRRIAQMFPEYEPRHVHLGANLGDLIAEISRAACVVSSALHPIIVAHSYQVPCLWVDVGDSRAHPGGTYKFEDYYSAIDLSPHPVSFEDIMAPSHRIRGRAEDVLARSVMDTSALGRVQSDLMQAFPAEQLGV